MSRQTWHVSPHKGGGWQVKGAGNNRPSKVTNTKDSAITVGKTFAKNVTEGQIVIHGKDGKIQTEHTYGNDPCPPKG